MVMQKLLAPAAMAMRPLPEEMNKKTTVTVPMTVAMALPKTTSLDVARTSLRASELDIDPCLTLIKGFFYLNWTSRGKQ